MKLDELMAEVNWGNTLFSTINFSLVFWAWFRIGKTNDKLMFNYMKFFVKKHESNIFKLWFVGQIHATFVFGFLLDNLRTFIDWDLLGIFATFCYGLVIWIGKDNQAIHLNITRELAARKDAQR